MCQITLSALEYPTETKARVRLQEGVLRINDPKAFKAHNKPTLGLVIDRFIKEERLEEIATQPPGKTSITDGFSWSTAASYRSNLKTHIWPKWGNTSIHEIKALEISEWLKSLPLSPKTHGHVGALLHLLFKRAMLWNLMDVQSNPSELVKLKGASKRMKKP
jgi:hypothetical protein